MREDIFRMVFGPVVDGGWVVPMLVGVSLAATWYFADRSSPRFWRPIFLAITLPPLIIYWAMSIAMRGSNLEAIPLTVGVFTPHAFLYVLMLPFAGWVIWCRKEREPGVMKFLAITAGFVFLLGEYWFRGVLGAL